MISVLVVSHNTRDYLAHTLTRLAEDGGDAVQEVIVVDNASTDGSPQMVREDFPTVRLLAQEDNLGFGAANNLGAATARGQALLLLNSDAWPTPGALDLLANQLNKDPQLGALTPALAYPNGSPQFAWAPWTGVPGEALQKLRNPWESHSLTHRPLPRPFSYWVTAACLLVRRRAFEAIGGFDEDFFLYFEDVDLCRRLHQAGWRLGVEPRALAYHIKGASDRGHRAELEYRRSQLRYYTKHRSAWEQRFLKRRLRRRFQGVGDGELRGKLLKLLDD